MKNEVKSVEVEEVKASENTVKTEAPKAPEFDKDELLHIFDEIIFSGEYTEEINIRGKLKIVFRARSAEETTTISREIDGKNFTLITTLQEHRALLNLAYSLVGYAGKDLSKVSIDDRKAILNRLPAAMVATLSNRLSTFDLKVDMACREGEVNF